MTRRGMALQQPVRKLSSTWRPHSSSLDRVQALFSPEAAVRWAEALIAAGKPRPAFQHYVRAARSGLTEAEYRIGRCYLEGVGVPLSRAEAVRWLERAGDHGHAEAQSLLALLYLHGMAYQRRPEVGTMAANSFFSANETTGPDWMTAARWARMAAENSSAEGQAVLAFLLTSGPPEMRNLDEADCWYERSAAASCPQGMLGHALALARKSNGELQCEEISYLARAAEAGLPEALYLLGVINEHGLGVASDKAAAAKFYRSAAEKGHRSGEVRFGLALIHGVGVNANPFEGESWLRRAALGGDPEAAFLIGDLYAKGGTLPPNYVEAAKWFRRAAEASQKGAARALGQLYLTGAGVPPDPEEAARWFRIAAAAGDSAARAELGNLVLKGIGGQDDRVRACQWFAEAAESGDLVAAFNFGVCLAQGVGVTQDDKQAAFWLRKAADGVVDAQYWYGRVLIEGRGVDRDLPKGRSWVTRAAERGMLDAQVALAEMMLEGAGGQRDPQGALALFEEAVTKGHAGAMFAIAAMHDAGHGVQADRLTAQRWYRAAAESGHTAAQLMLGRYLARGLAGEYDPEQSRHWLKKALAQGQADAAQDLAALSGAVALEVDLTESPVKPRQEDLCACGSHLRSCRCCELDPKYRCTPEASEQAGLFASRAAEALARGDATEAETICLKVLDIAPRLPSALWILYQVLRRGGDQRAAKTLLQRLVALEPNNVHATQELATLLFEQGGLEAAEQHARNAIRLAPEDSRSHNLMGMILTETQRPQIGEFHYRRVLEISGLRDAILLANLAWNLKCQGKIAEARKLYEESIEAAPDIFQTLFGWAQLEEADRNFIAARSLLNRAAELRPDDRGLQVARATLLTRESDYAAALAELEPRPAAGENGSSGDALLGSIALAEKGRILDRMERYDEAFACFQEAKRRVHQETGKCYLDHEAQEIAKRLRQFFVSGHMRLMPPAPVRKECAQPIFILGFPRSGTTLAEQVLSSHPRISAGDELPFINEVCSAIPRLFGSPLAYPEALADLWMGDNRRGLETLRDVYLQKVQIRGIVKAGSVWFTDKMPLNEMHLGLISLVFPGSPLIHIQRHPLDVVLSVFSHHLTHGYFCAYALETAARHYALVMDLVQHYRTEMALRYLPVRYEDMVQDMRGSVRRILAFVGESLDERCVNFHENRRLPHTPSYTQVSEKLYDRSRFRYRHYLKHLEPVIPILQPLMDRLGYTLDTPDR
jgi:TPR repeat protein